MNNPSLSTSQQQMLVQAVKLMNQQQYPAAEQALRNILAQWPDCAEALHQLGILAYNFNKISMAIDYIERAIVHNSQSGLYHANCGEMYRQTGNLQQAVSHGKMAVKLAPGLVMAHCNLGIAWYDQGDDEQAEICQKKAIELSPKYSPALNNLGSICRRAKRMDEAINYYRAASKVNPQNHEAICNLSAGLVEEERFTEARPLLENLLADNPKYPEAQCNMGFVLKGLNHNKRALSCFNAALSLRHEYAEAYSGIAGIEKDDDRLDSANQHIQKALEIDPNNAAFYSLSGSIKGNLGQNDAAKEAYQKALSLDVSLHGAYIGLGELQNKLGELDAAKKNLSHAIKLRPQSIPARCGLMYAGKCSQQDDNLQKMIELLSSTNEMTDDDTMQLYFAIGKGFDDIGHYDEAFSYYMKGCKLKRSTFSYTPDDINNLVKQLARLFMPETFQRFANQGHDSQLPVFIVGMPRSGTTLTEQIIASHPQVHGAGELDDLIYIVQRQTELGACQPYPVNLQNLSASHLHDWGHDYLTNLQNKAPDALRVIDKLPMNYLNIGLIHCLFPNARIIHLNRQPLDTCVSCFSRLFRHNCQHFSYDLNDLAQYYLSYEKMMQHWRSVLPPGVMLDLHYESLVESTEQQARQLIDFCGLDWHDDCLNFHQNKRAVQTASQIQVRQPIYRGAVNRWKRYEKFLMPLIEVLGECDENFV
jgi:tetratricopeptide (TPR) repeat protein